MYIRHNVKPLEFPTQLCDTRILQPSVVQVESEQKVSGAFGQLLYYPCTVPCQIDNMPTMYDIRNAVIGTSKQE